MTETTTINRGGRKFDQVLEGARRMFLVEGFEGATMDDVAQAANVSKATLYSYFPDKRHLFMEVATRECRRQADLALEEIDLSAPVRQVLGAIAHRLTAFLLSDLGQRVFRICVAEADRFPDLARAFYASGPAFVKDAMVDYFASAIERGELVIGDRPLAADQFAELCKADLWPRMVFGLETSFTEAEVNRVIDGAVETFMARYGG